jgi:hypothetical protein
MHAHNIIRIFDFIKRIKMLHNTNANNGILSHYLKDLLVYCINVIKVKMICGLSRSVEDTETFHQTHFEMRMIVTDCLE